MQVKTLCRLCAPDIIYQSISDESAECDFHSEIRHLYPGCSITQPAPEGFWNSFTCSQQEWDWFLASYPLDVLPANALFVIYGAEECKNGYGKLPKGNIIYFKSSAKNFFTRIANLPLERGAALSADAIYKVFWRYILENRTADYATIASFLEKLPHRLNQYLSVIVMHFFTDSNGTMTENGAQDEQLRVSSVLSALNGVFPRTNFFYNPDTKEFIVLYSQQKRDNYAFYYPLHSFSYQNLSKFLERFHLHAGLSNSTQAIEHIYTLYLSARSAMELGEAMNSVTHFPNIYHDNEFTPYKLMQYAVPAFLQQYGHDNILYLVHPAVVKLGFYDAEHETTLLKTLHAYLENGHNIQRAAASMHIHRNTMCNRLKKITEITALSVEEPTVQGILLLSCQIMRFYQDVMKKRI